jgi:hypothetical protein
VKFSPKPGTSPKFWRVSVVFVGFSKKCSEVFLKSGSATGVFGVFGVSCRPFYAKVFEDCNGYRAAAKNAENA